MTNEFAAEVIRVALRYATEFVERYNFCPFAIAARTRDEVKRIVLPVDAERTVAEIEALRDETHFAVGLFIYPHGPRDFASFEAFVAQLRPIAQTLGFATAAFHPQARFAADNASRLTNYFRRTPDPTLQLVRFSVLDDVRNKVPAGKFLYDARRMSLKEATTRAETESVSDQIARHNFEQFATVGEAELEAVLADIARDRDASYARFAKQ